MLLRVKNLLKVKEYQDFLADHNRILEEQVEVRTAALQESEEKFRKIGLRSSLLSRYFHISLNRTPPAQQI